MWQHSYKWLLCCATLVCLPLHAACDVKEKEVIGAWQSVSQDGFFDVFELHQNHTFDSWLHERPEISDAKWLLEHCILTIDGGEQLNFIYQVKLNRQQLVLTEEINGSQQVSHYRRIKE